MQKYLVERTLPGFDDSKLLAAARQARITAGQMSREGTPVRYLRSTFLPGEEKCFCLFEAASSELVRQANTRAGLPFDRIMEAVHVTAEDVT